MLSLCSSGDKKPSNAGKSGKAAAPKAAGSAVLSAVAGSSGSLLVQAAAKLAGQTVAVQSADSFSLKSGNVVLTSPIAAALYLSSKVGFL